MRARTNLVHPIRFLVALCAALAAAQGCSSSDAPPAVCGNSAVESGEACDDGNAIAGDGCEADCTFTCEADAACDDGDPCSGVETCSGAHACAAGTPLDDLTACTTAAVADGVCRSGACVAVGCGNGLVDPGEGCDDGDADDTDACLSTCVAASCGDGFVQAGVEECDGDAPRACTTSCSSTGWQACVSASCAWEASCTPPAETCNGADDSCDGAVDEGGDVVFTGTPDWRGLVGNTTLGSFREDACPAGEAVIGFDGEFTTSGHIGSVRTHCGNPSLACAYGTCTTTFAPATTLPLRGTGTGGGTWSAICPADQAMFGYRAVAFDGGVNLLKGIVFRCAPVTATPPGSGWTLQVGTPTALPLVGTNEGASAGADCPPGQVATVVVTRAGAGVHGIGASCQVPAAGCP